MKIYQTSSFVQEDSKVICTIDCKLVPWLCGKPLESEAVEFSVSAYAKCSPADDFDLTFGKRLSETRASLKVFQRIKRILGERACNLVKEVREVDDDFLKVEYLIQDTIMHEAELISE